MNSFCGILDTRSTELDFARLKDMGKALIHTEACAAEACIDRGIGIFCVGSTAPLAAEATPRGELYIAIDTSETNVSTTSLRDIYLSIGYDTPRELNGHFALAVLDRRKRELLLATDPIGAKPIFIYQDGNKVIISTAIQALLRYSPACAEVDKAALIELIRAPDGEVRATDIYKSISELSAGHFMIFSGLGAQLFEYSAKANAFIAAGGDLPVKKLVPDRTADLKKSAEELTTALGYPAFDEYTPEYISTLRAASQENSGVSIEVKRHCLSNPLSYRKLYALSAEMGVSITVSETDDDTVFKRSFLAEREKRLSEIAASILRDNQSHTKRLLGSRLETIVSKETGTLAKIGIWGKIIGLERWLESYPIIPV